MRCYTGEVDVPEHLLEPIRRVATTCPEARAIYVFGSQAVGGVRPDSDLDLGVLYRTAQALAATLGLEQDFEQATGRKIDLIDLGRASAFLALDIVRGERVFCRDATETDRFELYVLRRAGDLLPFERQRHALLLASP